MGPLLASRMAHAGTHRMKWMTEASVETQAEDGTSFSDWIAKRTSSTNGQDVVTKSDDRLLDHVPDFRIRRVQDLFAFWAKG